MVELFPDLKSSKSNYIIKVKVEMKWKTCKIGATTLPFLQKWTNGIRAITIVVTNAVLKDMNRDDACKCSEFILWLVAIWYKILKTSLKK